MAPLKRDHALLDPTQLSGMAEQAAHKLMAEGESDNTRLAYRAAMYTTAAEPMCRSDGTADDTFADTGVQVG